MQPFSFFMTQVICCSQDIAGLDCWIAQSGLQFNLVDRIVIDSPNTKSDFGFGLSIQFCCYPKYQNYFIKKSKF